MILQILLGFAFFCTTFGVVDIAGEVIFQRSNWTYWDDIYESTSYTTTLENGHRWEIWKIDANKLDHTLFDDSDGLQIYVTSRPTNEFRASVRKNDMDFQFGHIDTEIWDRDDLYLDDDSVRVCDVETGVYYLNISWEEDYYDYSARDTAVWYAKITRTGNDWDCSDLASAFGGLIVLLVILLICCSCCIFAGLFAAGFCVVGTAGAAVFGCCACCLSKKKKKDQQRKNTELQQQQQPNQMTQQQPYVNQQQQPYGNQPQHQPYGNQPQQQPYGNQPQQQQYVNQPQQQQPYGGAPNPYSQQQPTGGYGQPPMQQQQQYQAPTQQPMYQSPPPPVSTGTTQASYSNPPGYGEGLSGTGGDIGGDE